MRARALGVTSLTAAVLALAPPSSAADAKHACVAAAHEGQSLRDSGKLSDARERFLACGAEACPALVRESCQRWAAEVATLLPTIVLAARDAKGNDLAEVRVSIDGAVTARTLDGRSLPIDPGPHELLFEAEGFSPARQSLIVREGEKARTVTAVLARPGNVEIADAEAPPPRASRNLMPLVVAGAASAVGLSGFAVFGLWGNSEKDRLSETCAASQTCAPSDVSAARTKLIVADVSLVVGLAGAGVFAAYLLAPMLRGEPAPAPRKSASSFDIRPTGGGVFGAFEYTY